METCKKSSSTGVSRPKMETKISTLPLASSIELTVPSKSVKGPSTIFIASPTEKLAWNFGACCLLKAMTALTSSSGRAVGKLPIPTKPVTPWVVRTANQESSVISILIIR